MHPQPLHPEADQVLSALVEELTAALGRRLRAVYLFGSLATGDFDEGVSDIDLVVAHADALTDDDLVALQSAHSRVARRFQAFDDRLDLNYFHERALRRYKPAYAQARISPGEPFHVTTVGSDWILNRWQVRERGIALVGPPPADLIDPIDSSELRIALRVIAREWWAWIDRETGWPRPLQSYAILTTCRILHSLERREVVSKRRAAAWAREMMIGHADVIADAWRWRSAFRDDVPDAGKTLPATLAFLAAARERMSRALSPTEIVAAGYDALGERYASWAAAADGDPRAGWLGEVSALLPARASVLDLGCGPGVTTEWLAQRYEVTAVDVSAAQVALARRAAPGARFVVADMTAVEFPARSFDAVVALFSLIHLPTTDLGPMLRRIAAWLRPGGLLLATLGTIEGEGVQDDWLGVPMFFAGATPERNRQLLAAAGFVLLRDDVVTLVEPEEAEVSFHWIMGRGREVPAIIA